MLMNITLMSSLLHHPKIVHKTSNKSVLEIGNEHAKQLMKQFFIKTIYQACESDI